VDSARRAARRAADAVGSLRGERGRVERPVNPPFRDAAETPEAPIRPPAPREWQPPAVVAVEEAERSDEHESADSAKPPPAFPAPVHVPYARSDTEPDVVAAPSARPVSRRPGRSPFWAAVRSHVWLVMIVLALAAAVGTAYWALRVHQRISASTLERGIAGREHTNAVRCVEQQSNGSVWACGLVYQASSVCLIANVNPVGDWTTNDGAGLCEGRPELTAILPDRITAAAVSADMSTQLGMTDARCAKLPEHKVRWACVGSSAGGGCLLVRVAPWNSLATQQSTVCDRLPALRKRLREPS
jgi:hypothetical protein